MMMKKGLDLAVLIALGVGMHELLKFPREAIWDQSFVSIPFSLKHYPNLEGGLFSNLLAGLMRRFVYPAPANPNGPTQAVALFLYTIPWYCVARRSLRSTASLGIFVLLLFSSRFPFLWLSSELFAGGLLGLSALSYLSSWSPWITGGFAAAFGLCKPDLALPALVLTATLAWKSPKGRKAGILWGFLSAFFVLNLPGLLTSGISQFAVQNRSFLAFGQHYSFLIQKHQLVKPTPDAWTQWDQYISKVFPGAQSLSDILLHYPNQYWDFVGLSCIEFIRRSFMAYSWTLFLFPVWWLKLRYGQNRIFQLGPLELILLALGTALLAPIFMASLHVRYLAKIYPLAILVFLQMSEGFFQESGVWRKAMGVACFTVLAVCGLLALAPLREDFRSLHHGATVFWFPD